MINLADGLVIIETFNVADSNILCEDTEIDITGITSKNVSVLSRR